jgi:hypothetical protein
VAGIPLELPNSLEEHRANCWRLLRYGDGRARKRNTEEVDTPAFRAAIARYRAPHAPRYCCHLRRQLVDTQAKRERCLPSNSSAGAPSRDASLAMRQNAGRILCISRCIRHPRNAFTAPSRPLDPRNRLESHPRHDPELRSGRRDSNARQPAWKAGALPLSYSRGGRSRAMTKCSRPSATRQRATTQPRSTGWQARSRWWRGWRSAAAAYRALPRTRRSRRGPRRRTAPPRP